MTESESRLEQIESLKAEARALTYAAGWDVGRTLELVRIAENLSTLTDDD